MNRIVASFEDGKDVAEGRAGPRCDNTDLPWQCGNGAFSLWIEESFLLKLFLELIEGKL